MAGDGWPVPRKFGGTTAINSACRRGGVDKFRGDVDKLDRVEGTLGACCPNPGFRIAVMTVN